MSKINYPASSPYASSPQTSWYLGKLTYRPVAPASDDQPFTITKQYENRPDALSYFLYGTPAYWWVFAVRNRNLLHDPVWDMVAGLTIIVPSLSTIKKALGS